MHSLPTIAAVLSIEERHEGELGWPQTVQLHMAAACSSYRPYAYTKKVPEGG